MHSARSVVVFAQCVRAVGPVLRVCLAARPTERRRALANTALRVCSDRAQVARATLTMRHASRCDRHVLACASSGAPRRAREICSAYGGAADALARRSARAVIYICAARLARQWFAPRVGNGGFQLCAHMWTRSRDNTICKIACNDCATVPAYSDARRQHTAAQHGRATCNDTSPRSCSAARCKTVATRASLHVAMACNA